MRSVLVYQLQRRLPRLRHYRKTGQCVHFVQVDQLHKQQFFGFIHQHLFLYVDRRLVNWKLLAVRGRSRCDLLQLRLGTICIERRFIELTGRVGRVVLRATEVLLLQFAMWGIARWSVETLFVFIFLSLELVDADVFQLSAAAF